jgi:hypothetical protein
MKVPTKSELIHHKIQAAMRENFFDEDQMKYLGERDGEHWYLIANEHEVPVSCIEDFEMTNDEEDDT